MKRGLSFLAALALYAVLVPTAMGSVLSTFTGQGTDFPTIGADRTTVKVWSYTVRHGLQRHVYVGTYDLSQSGDGVFRIDPYGTVDWVASGLAGSADDIWADYDGTVLYTSWDSFRVIRVLLDNTIVPVAGNGTEGYSGDGGPATQAQISPPEGIATDADGNIYFTDYSNCVVRKVARVSGIITTVAGNDALGCGFGGDGGPATAAQLKNPEKLIVDSVGNILIADTHNAILRKVDTSGIITTVAGTREVLGCSGDGGAATLAQLKRPEGVDVDQPGNTYVADRDCNVIRKIDRSGNITTVAGTGVSGYLDDATNAAQGMLNGPVGVTVDADGQLYVADWEIKESVGWRSTRTARASIRRRAPWGRKSSSREHTSAP